MHARKTSSSTQRCRCNQTSYTGRMLADDWCASSDHPTKVRYLPKGESRALEFTWAPRCHHFNHVSDWSRLHVTLTSTALWPQQLYSTNASGEAPRIGCFSQIKTHAVTLRPLWHAMICVYRLEGHLSRAHDPDFLVTCYKAGCV